MSSTPFLSIRGRSCPRKRGKPPTVTGSTTVRATHTALKCNQKRLFPISLPLGSGFFLANGAAYDIMALKMRKREKKIRVYLKSGNMTNSEGFFV